MSTRTSSWARAQAAPTSHSPTWPRKTPNHAILSEMVSATRDQHAIQTEPTVLGRSHVSSASVRPLISILGQPNIRQRSNFLARAIILLVLIVFAGTALARILIPRAMHTSSRGRVRFIVDRQKNLGGGLRRLASRFLRASPPAAHSTRLRVVDSTARLHLRFVAFSTHPHPHLAGG